jgi:hypothetical protein
MGIILRHFHPLQNPHDAVYDASRPDVTNFLVSFPWGRILHEHFVYISLLLFRVTYSVFDFITVLITEYYMIIRTQFPLIWIFHSSLLPPDNKEQSAALSAIKISYYKMAKILIRFNMYSYSNALGFLKTENMFSKNVHKHVSNSYFDFYHFIYYTQLSVLLIPRAVRSLKRGYWTIQGKYLLR